MPNGSLADTASTILCATNELCDLYNAERISKLNGQMFTYSARDYGPRYILDKLSAAKLKLYLKAGCPIILTANVNDKLVNGMRGKVVSLNTTDVSIKLDFDSTVHKIEQHQFSLRHHNRTFSRYQYPIRLAYSLTIHRAQGQTLSKVHLDATGIQTFSMLGVALSRVRSPKDISINNLRLSTLKATEANHMAFINTGRAPLVQVGLVFVAIITLIIIIIIQIVVCQ